MLFLTKLGVGVAGGGTPAEGAASAPPRGELARLFPRCWKRHERRVGVALCPPSTDAGVARGVDVRSRRGRDAEPLVGAARANVGDERYENADMQACVTEEFGKERWYAGVPRHVVDGGRAVDPIHDDICQQAAAIAIRQL